MIFDITEFRSAVTNFQKLHHYRMRFPYPPLCQTIYGPTFAIDRKLEFFTNTIDWPGVALKMRPINRYGYGHSENKPVAAQFNQIMITFYADSDADNLSFMHAWFNSIYNFDLSQGVNPLSLSGSISPFAKIGSPMELAYADEYKVDGWLTLYDTSETAVYTVYFREMFPMHIPEIKMDWSLTNQIAQITVLFSYTDWYTYLGDVDSQQPKVKNGILQGPPANGPTGPPATIGTGTPVVGG